MRIEQLTIKNYRSFSDETKISFSKVGKPISIIGHNNAGKTNLIDSLLYVLGKKSTYGNNFSKNDFFNHNINNNIIIKAKITEAPFQIQADAFNKTKQIDHIQLKISSDTGYCETTHTLCDKDGKQIRLAQSTTLSKTKEYTQEEKKAFTERQNDGLLYFSKVKNKIPIYFIDPTNIQEELSPRKNSLLGDIMKKVKSSFEKGVFTQGCPKNAWIGKTRKEVFNHFLDVVEKQVLKTEELDDLIDTIKKEIMTQLGLSEENFSLNLSLPDVDIFYKNLEFMLKDNNDPAKPQLPITNYGRGFLLLFIVALLKILSREKEGGNIFVIEEPETFLHEHYQEYFYKVLCELAIKNQVIYTTHSKKFIDLFDPRTIIKLENDCAKKTKVIQSDEEFLAYPTDYAKYITSIEPNLGNLIFSDKVLIVEGAHDILAYKTIFQQDVNFGMQNISIIAAFGKDGILNLVKLCKLYHIDYFVIHDWDLEDPNIDISLNITDSNSVYNNLQKEHKQQYTKNHKLLMAAGKEKIHHNKKRLEEVLGIPQSEKGCESIYNKLKEKTLEDIKTDYPNLVNDAMFAFLNL